MSKFIKNKNNELFIIPEDIDVDESVYEVLKPNTKDAALEKHVPIVDVDGNKVKVIVGEVNHPMLDEHYINDIILVTDKGTYSKKLNPNTEPVAEFVIDEDEVPEEVYEYCNLHGLWKKDL